ncbi:NAD-dependent epimerase/dehydratase family protein [Jiangella rhizosphaerae]|uniref:NAD-dependent epimerase/dehydratase family protein n=1 Tax=Jiangella rhizosphaerae TaxID=2293569 RepID=A0A418KX23_9ACTN|nr:NAD-dependent epimerase/dehydratase family protein [Jiangella rhizosphaerae]RIQ37438.1 NAD-dependent epimerase/dehydratase family protein [Jiangella rhizosphaerae]
MNGARVVVTGGAGFLGSHVCEALIGAGAEVVCLDNHVTSTPANLAGLVDEPGFSFVSCDVSDGIRVDGPVDLVLHLASPASPVDYLRLPLETMRAGSAGTTNALELALEKGARFVLASTSEVYGDPLRHPQPEDYWGNVNPIGPRAVYDESKRFSETLSSAYRSERGVDTGIVRIFNSYGPRMRAHDGRVVPTFIRQALAGEPLTVAGDGSQTRTLCYVADTVGGLLAMAGSDHPGPVNIGGSHEVTVLELAERIRSMTGSRSRIRFVDLPENDPRLRRPDLTRASRLLRWRPRVRLSDGLAQTVRWFADAGIDGVPAGQRSSVATASRTSPG